MPKHSRAVGFATIGSVSRTGGDIVLRLRDAMRGGRLCYQGRVTFVGVTHLESADLRNSLVPRTLEPGWTVSDLTFEAGTASLGVFRIDMHDQVPVVHRIACRDVRVRMRPAVLATLWNVVRGL